MKKDEKNEEKHESDSVLKTQSLDVKEMEKIRNVKEFNPPSIPITAKKETDMFQFKTDPRDFKDFNGESLVTDIKNQPIVFCHEDHINENKLQYLKNAQ